MGGSMRLVLSSAFEGLKSPIEIAFFPGGSLAGLTLLSSIAATASRLTLDFPKTTATLALDSIERESSFDTRLQQEDYLDLWARISKTAFAISHLGKDDLLNVVAISPVHYLGGVFHNPRKRTTQCIVRCADGNSSQDCVICEHGDVTIKNLLLTR
jgi:hypothetical protein